MARAKPWLKLWTEWASDTKIIRLSLAERGAWCGLLTLGRICSTEGRIISGNTPLSIDEMCDTLHISKPEEVSQFKSMLTKMEGQGSLSWNENGNGKCLTIVNFVARQDKAPSDSAEAVKERVREYRRRHSVTGKVVTEEVKKREPEKNIKDIYIELDKDCVTALHPHSEVEAVTEKVVTRSCLKKVSCNGAKSLHSVTFGGHKVATKKELPNWLNKETWDAYLEMRKFKRAPPTSKAVDLIIKKLDTLRASGQDVTEILNQSIVNNWTGIFPLRKDGKFGESKQSGRSFGTQYTSPEEGRRQYKQRYAASNPCDQDLLGDCTKVEK
ncbi:MAG: hypothetical protein PHI12_08275 [Dehalococcoidales bacterium]|nr:hypothetical protein [Dehalococcoidales bacterium]